MQFGDAMTRFHTQLCADGRSPHTVNSYLRALRNLRGWLREDGLGRDPDIGDVTPDHLARFIVSDAVALKADGGPRSVVSTNHIKSSVRAFFRYLAETEGLAANPARALRCKPAGQAIPNVLTDEEQARLLAAIAQHDTPAAVRDYVIFAVFLATGIRIAALVGLDTSDVDIDARRMAVIGKGGRRESVILSTRLADLLRRHINALPDAGPLFRSNRGTRISIRQVQFRLKHWLGAAGIEKRVTVHGLRHTFGAKLYAHTKDLRLVQRALHHRQVTTTEIYTRVGDGRLAAAIEAVG